MSLGERKDIHETTPPTNVLELKKMVKKKREEDQSSYFIEDNAVLEKKNSFSKA